MQSSGPRNSLRHAPSGKKDKKKKKKGNGGFVHMAYSCWRTFAARSSSLLAAVSFYF